MLRYNKMTQETLFNKIVDAAKKFVTREQIIALTTKNGNTQVSERFSIPLIRNVLDQLGLDYKEAGSQQSKDFRNVHHPNEPNIQIDIEIKKTDGNTITFNDTCPNENIWYIIFFTGKQNTRTSIPPGIIGINGMAFLQDSEWISEYQREIEAIKDKYCRGLGKKMLSGNMSVYVRPTYRANINMLLGEL